VERNVQRINGEKARLHNLDNQELDSVLTHALLRLDKAQQDVDKILYERHRRILGSVAIQGELDFDDFNDGFSTDGLGRE
jgi:hypothetical protein